MEKWLEEYWNGLVRQIEHHQKMEFELRMNLEELAYLIKTKNYELAKEKSGV